MRDALRVEQLRVVSLVEEGLPAALVRKVKVHKDRIVVLLLVCVDIVLRDQSEDPSQRHDWVNHVRVQGGSPLAKAQEPVRAKILSECEALAGDSVPELNVAGAVRLGLLLFAHHVGCLAFWQGVAENEESLELTGSVLFINVNEVVGQKNGVLFVVSSTEV